MKSLSKSLFTAWFALCLASLSGAAHAALEIVITESTNAARPIAVVPMTKIKYLHIIDATIFWV